MILISILGYMIGFFLIGYGLRGLWSGRPWKKPPRPMDDPIRTALRASPAGDDHIRFEMGRIHLITDSAGPESLVHVVSKEEAEEFVIGVYYLIHGKRFEESDW